MKVDVVFIDNVSPFSYEIQDLERKAMGGTEQATCRLAEGLAAQGLKVAVLQKNRKDEIMGRAFYLPISYAELIEPRVVIHLRSISTINLYPSAKNFVWLHDIADERCEKWVKPLEDVEATVIGVSDWHVNQIRTFLPYNRMVRAYSPVDEMCYLPETRAKAYNPNKLVWLASPHKGLSEALDVFEKLQKQSPKTELLVFNPNYVAVRPAPMTGVQYLGASPRQELRGVVTRSLCLFYPTEFRETFGMIAAESEALGTPVACYNIGALCESVGQSGFCKDETDLIEKVLAWQKERPVVTGQEKFRLVNVVKDWLKVLFP